MEMFNAYEVLDELAKKSKMFEMIRDEFTEKDEKIAQISDNLQRARNDNLTSLMALTEIYEIVLMMQIGGV